MYPSLALSLSDSSISAGRSSLIRSGVIRTVGPVMLSAATTSPLAPRTGAAIAASPTSSSSIAVANLVATHLRELGPQRVRVGDRGRCVRAKRACASGRKRATESQEDLAVGGAVVVDACARPTGRRRGSGGRRPAAGARRRPAPGTPRLIVSPLRWASASSRRARDLDEVALEHPALGHAQDRGPGAQPSALSLLLDQAASLAAPTAAARPCSWAARQRSRARSRPSARPASSTRTSRSAPRSMAVVPAGRLASENELETLVPRPLGYAANHVRQLNAPLRDPQRGRARGARSAAGAGSSPRSESSSCSPRPSSCCAQPARSSRTRTASASTPSSSSSRSPRRPANSSCRRATRRTVADGRRRQHGVRARVRLPVHPRGRRPPRRQDGRLREPGEALAGASTSSTPPAGRSASPRTGRWTRATSTWSTRCRR